MAHPRAIDLTDPAHRADERDRAHLRELEDERAERHSDRWAGVEDEARLAAEGMDVYGSLD